MEPEDWEIPANLQPQPDDYRFDLERALNGVVGLRANVPDDAFTAGTLGTERIGNGAIIRDDGLVLTIGYLITEAETIWLITADGRAVPACPVAYDGNSGLGLVQALGKLGQPALQLGDSDRLSVGADVIMAAAGGRRHAIETRVVSRQEFAGYWEYVLDEAIFIAPAHPFWSGSALIAEDGTLLGTGSLSLQQGDGPKRADMNMVVPVSLLRGVLDDMLALGRPKAPPRPWLGIYAMEGDEGLIVGGLSEKGPAARAGLRQGDRILGVGDEDVTELATLWRKVWQAGPAGATVLLRVGRDGTRLAVRVTSADRQSFLRPPKLH